MNERPPLINTFAGGVAGDFDPQRVGDKVLTYSLNGRVIYNDAGTLSWQNGNGNKLVITLGFNYGIAQARPYTIIGGIEISNYLVLYSTQNTYEDQPLNRGYSEVGLLTENQPGVFVYQTIFNDQYDPNGQLLHFNSRYQIKARAAFENKTTIRTYWVDDYNEDRVFNIVSGALPYINPITGTTYFATPYSAPYPYWYSVHGMAQLCDVQFGLIKYQKNIAGSKIAGVRQYFYRLRHMSGYATPWSLGSGMIFVTTPEVNPTDWTQYAMVNSGTATNKGHQLEIKYIDTRFTTIEVAWAYYASDVAPESAGIFFQGLITGTDMIVSDINETVVTPIPDPTTLIQRYTDILHSKTLEMNENYLHKANVVERGILEINTAGITVEPIIRLMASDVSQAQNTTPLTTGIVKTADNVSVELFENANGTPYLENYVIGDTIVGAYDYINYKGTQWDCLFKGEFRGQKVPLAIVILSRKGQPFFAQHIGDFQMPDMYGNEWQLEKLDPVTGNPIITTGTSRNNGISAVPGDYNLTTTTGTGFITTQTPVAELNGAPAINILGKLISGIDLTDILYDEYGDLQVSGFSIVRADRIPNLIAQGLVLNVSNISSTDTPIVGDGNVITPLHSTGNAYFLNNGAPTSGGQNSYRNENIDHGGPSGSHSVSATIISNYFTLELPDNLINPATIGAFIDGEPQGTSAGFYLEIVGAVQGTYIADGNQEQYVDCVLDGGTPGNQTGSQPTQLAYTSFYTKNYITDTDNLIRSDQTPGTVGPATASLGLFSNTNQIGDLGSESQIEKIWTPGTSTVGQTTGIDNFKFTNAAFLSDFFFDIDCSGIYHGLGAETQVVVKTPANTLQNASLANSFGYVLPASGGQNNICYLLANIVSGQSNVLNASIIANRIYKNIGHFVPINPTTIAAATQTNGRVVFNQCEVWGGDCYVDYFGYGRLIPLLANANGSGKTPAFYDYGVGLIFPCETVNNHTMRIGNTFPNVALRPGVDESEAISTNPVFNAGLYYNFNDSSDAREEDFDLNAVMQATDEVEAFNTKGIYYVDEPDQPLLECVSNLKIAGETYDQFRLFLVNNNQTADSQFGWICDLEAIGINIYVLQEKGFGRIRFNERTLESTSQANLTVGTGEGYQGHDYLGGADFGCQHLFSVYNNRKGIGWVNAYEGKDCHFGGNGLECFSDLFGQHTYYTNTAEQYWQIPYPLLQDNNENIYDNPVGVGGIASVYDSRNRAKINTFTQQLMVISNSQGNQVVPNPNVIPSTMEFSESESKYQGNWSYAYGIYFPFKKDFFAPDTVNTNQFYEFNIGAKGSFSGVVTNSKFEFIVRAERQDVYDNMELDIQPSAFAALESFTGTTVNSSQVVNFNDPADNRPVYRNSAAVFATMQINQTTRLRGSYLDVLFEIDNSLNIDLLATEARSYVRKDYR